MKYLVLYLLFISACSITTPSSVDDILQPKPNISKEAAISQKYPLGHFKVNGFVLLDNLPDNATFTSEEKNTVMLMLDFMKVVFNDPEFENFLGQRPKSQDLIKKRSGTQVSYDGKRSITVNDPINTTTVLGLYQNLPIQVTIRKGTLGANVLAVAFVNNRFMYLEPPRLKTSKYFQDIHNNNMTYNANAVFSTNNYRNFVSLMGTLVHEMGHQLGFSHENTENFTQLVSKDVSYQMGYAFEEYARANEARLLSNLKEIQGYHKSKHPTLDYSTSVKSPTRAFFRRLAGYDDSKPLEPWTYHDGLLLLE